MDGESTSSTVVYLFISNFVFVLLFCFSEYLGESSCSENGVFSLVSRRIFCLGNRRIRLNVSLEPRESVVTERVAVLGEGKG
jgi:hypothetical protein